MVTLKAKDENDDQENNPLLENEDKLDDTLCLDGAEKEKDKMEDIQQTETPMDDAIESALDELNAEDRPNKDDDITGDYVE